MATPRTGLSPGKRAPLGLVTRHPAGRTRQALRTLLTIEEVTPSCAALFGWVFSPAIRDLDPPPAGRRDRRPAESWPAPPRPGAFWPPSGLTDRGRHLEADYRGSGGKPE